MTNTRDPSERQLLADASQHLRAAIELLDRAGAPGQIAAHADLALDQLDRLIAATRFTPEHEAGECFGTTGSS